jgi:4-hydroxybenzoate polyprenyltransferase
MAPVSINGQQNRHEDDQKRAQVSFIRSQLILLQSRKKWGALYSLATVAGLFGMPGILAAMGSEIHVLTFIQNVMPLPLISFLVSVGMYILNDLVDADLDRANGKKRPIPSGLVSKRQAWSFIVLTNGGGMLLSVITFNPVTMIILIPMLAIGIMYSAPKIALMNRFVIKTLAITSFYMLCSLLGITSGYGIELAVNNPATAVYIMVMLGIMIFISSTLNDLGDVEGDKAAGRRTIPVVLGGGRTIKLLIIQATSMMAISWILYWPVTGIGITTVVATSLFALLVITRLRKILHGLRNADMESMRKQHKKLFPLHMVLQSILATGPLI